MTGRKSLKSPLDNIRVLDMSRVLAGPWAGQLLGDYGADVVKVERPHAGDDTRHWGPPWLEGVEGGESAYFLCANRNKRSITIDIAKESGQQLIRELAAACDVLIENFRVGTMAKFGLSPEALLAINPRLVYCSISAYGQSGRRAQDPGYDAMIQGAAGLMSVTGPPEDNPAGPQKVGVAIADIMAGMYATTAILAALQSRTESGEGQHIDVPLYDSQVAWLANQNMNYLVGGEVPGRMGTAHPNLVPYQSFATADGNLMLAVGNDRQFAACCRVLGCDGLAEDERFATGSARVRHRDALVPLLQREFSGRTTAECLEHLNAAGVPAGPVNDIAEVLSNDHARERELVRTLVNGQGSSVPTVSNPVEFSATPVGYRAAPPLLGEHTDEVLRDWLGYSDERIGTLRSDAAI